MDYFEFTAGVAKEEAERVTTPVNEQTHFVEFTGNRSRVFRAICGESIHSGEVKARTSGWPTCPACKRLLDEYDLQEMES